MLIRRHFGLNENKNKTCINLRDLAKLIARGKISSVKYLYIYIFNILLEK